MNKTNLSFRQSVAVSIYEKFDVGMNSFWWILFVELVGNTFYFPYIVHFQLSSKASQACRDVWTELRDVKIEFMEGERIEDYWE